MERFYKTKPKRFKIKQEKKLIKLIKGKTKEQNLTILMGGGEDTITDIKNLYSNKTNLCNGQF